MAWWSILLGINLGGMIVVIMLMIMDRIWEFKKETSWFRFLFTLGVSLTLWPWVIYLRIKYYASQ